MRASQPPMIHYHGGNLRTISFGVCRVAFSLIIGAIAAACPVECEEFPSAVFVKPLTRLVRHSKVNMQVSAAWGLNRLVAHGPARGALAQVSHRSCTGCTGSIARGMCICSAELTEVRRGLSGRLNSH